MQKILLNSNVIERTYVSLLYLFYTFDDKVTSKLSIASTEDNFGLNSCSQNRKKYIQKYSQL